MTLFSPWALWFLALIPLVILMYILRQKFEEREISSTYLWHQVLKDMEVNTPWQRLKKNLLLFLQLLSLLLMIFALSDPYLNLNSRAYSRLMVVIDVSGSMNTIYEGGSSRLDTAKTMAEGLIKGAGADAEITVITAGKQPQIVLNKTASKTEAINAVKHITGDNSTGSIADAAELVKAVVKSEGTQASGYKAYFYTDMQVDTEGLNADVTGLGSKAQNVSLDYISHKSGDDGLDVLVRVTNRSDEKVMREISLYGGGELLDITSAELVPQETKTVYFNGIKTDKGYIWAEITEKDALANDNVIYEIVRSGAPQKVLMVSKQNIFMEKVLKTIDGIEVYKTNPGEAVEGKYDLYIYDGYIPAELPGAGNLILLNPPQGNSIVETGTEVDGGPSKANVNTLTRYADKGSFTVSHMKQLQTPYWADVLYSAGGRPAVISGEDRGRKIAVFAFDLHNSDFVLLPEFPIFTYNLMGYLLNLSSSTQQAYKCGDPINVSLLPEAREAYIKNPAGNTSKVELKYPVLPYENTTEAGIYELVQKMETSEAVSAVAVNFPVDSESAAQGYEGHENAGQAVKGAFKAGMAVQAMLIILIIILAAAEWVVYIRGY